VTWLAAGDLLGPVPVELDLQLKLAAERLGTDRLAVAASALLQVGPADGPCLVRRRVTCCLNYTVAGQPCATCPLLPPAETRRRLAADL
jgi:FhuF 2Fe-2S C-terminal domain